MVRFLRWIISLSGLLLAVANAGCFGSGPARTPCYAVRGEVVVDGQPAAGVRITLHPQEQAEAKYWEQGYPRGVTDAEGKFAIGTFGTDDGAPAGTYRVLAEWPPPAAAEPEGEETEETSDPESRDRLLGQYMNPEASPWTVTVQAQADNTQPRWELSTKPQPAPRR